MAEQKAPRRPWRLGLAQPLEQLRLRLRADAGHIAQPAGVRRGSKLLRRVNVECAGDLKRTLRGKTEEAAEADQVRRQLALELLDLRDLARLHELPQPRLDAGPDAAELADTSLPHEVCAPGAFVSRTSEAARR